MTQNPEYEIKRSNMDYDAMEGATMHYLESKGININLTPGLVLTATLGAAYGPPIYHIAQKFGNNCRREGDEVHHITNSCHTEPKG